MTEYSEAGIAQLLVRWRDRILQTAANNIEGHYFETPVEDLDSEQQGFEKGLHVAVDEICKLMNDPSYFGRTKTDL